MDRDDEVIRDGTDRRYGQRNHQSGHARLGPEGVDDLAGMPRYIRVASTVMTVAVAER
jgi:hypothetical protein